MKKMMEKIDELFSSALLGSLNDDCGLLFDTQCVRVVHTEKNIILTAKWIESVSKKVFLVCFFFFLVFLSFL